MSGSLSLAASPLRFTASNPIGGAGAAQRIGQDATFGYQTKLEIASLSQPALPALF